MLRKISPTKKTKRQKNLYFTIEYDVVINRLLCWDSFRTWACIERYINAKKDWSRRSYLVNQKVLGVSYIY